MGLRKVNGPRMPKRNQKGPNDYTESLRAEYAVSPKRPSRLGSNNAIVGMVEQCGKIHKDCKKGQEIRLKEEKPMAKQRPTLEKEQALKNEKPENGSCHKKPRMGSRKCRQAFRPR